MVQGRTPSGGHRRQRTVYRADLVSLVGGIIFAVAKQRFDAPGPLAEDKLVNIPPRQGIREIADLLLKEGVIEHSKTFILSATLAKTRDELKFGEYLFPRQASLHDVINKMVEGKVETHPVTFAEGLTSEQIVQRILEADVLTGNIKEIPREGSLLPETYRFTRGTPRDQVIQRMQQAERRLIQEIWDRRVPDLPLRSPDQLVTLASIVEKETGRADERPRVAAVFVNRLKQHMKLQSDPTIIYGLVGGKGTLGRPILRSEIEQPELPTTPTSSMACHRDRSPIPGAPRLRPLPIRRVPENFILSPTAPAVTPFPKRWTSIRRTWRSCARLSKRNGTGHRAADGASLPPRPRCHSGQCRSRQSAIGAGERHDRRNKRHPQDSGSGSVRATLDGLPRLEAAFHCASCVKSARSESREVRKSLLRSSPHQRSDSCQVPEQLFRGCPTTPRCRDGAVEHDRFRTRPRRLRHLWLGMGNQVGERQGP